MIFINEVAKIVHSSIDKFYGETNKNIGEAFLSVWKVNKKEKEELKSSKFNKRVDKKTSIKTGKGNK